MEHWEETVRDRAAMCLAILERLDPDLVKKFAMRVKSEGAENHDWHKRFFWGEIIETAEVNANLSVDRVLREADCLFGPEEPDYDERYDEEEDDDFPIGFD
jgi:hypothetical protein